MSALAFAAVVLFSPPNVGVQGLSTKVSFATAGASTAQVVKDLSAKTGVALATSPATEGDVVTIRAEDVPAQDLLNRIAWAVGGSWRPEGATYRLVRSPAEAEAERARERSSAIDAYAKSLSIRNDHLKDTPIFSADIADALAKETAAAITRFDPARRKDTGYNEIAAKLAVEAPSGRALTRLISLVKPDELADLPRGFKVVFSNQPTATQRPLGPKAAEVADVIEKLKDETAVWIRAMAKNGVDPGPVRNSTFTLPGVYSAFVPLNDVGKVLLTLTRSRSWRGYVQIELFVANKAGFTILSAGENLITDYRAYGSVPPVPAGEARFAQPAEVGIVMKSNAINQREILTNDLRTRVLQPEQVEPLSLTVGPMYHELAKARRANLVAAISDNDFVNEIFLDKDFSPTQLLHKLKGSNDVLEADGWLVLRPVNAASERPFRADRAALGTYLRRRAEPAALRFAERTAFAAKLPLNEEAPMAETLGGMVAGDGARVSAPDSRLLRILGSLTPAQYALAKEGRLSLYSLGAEPKRLIEEILYGRQVHFGIIWAAVRAAKLDPLLYDIGIWNQATECLPDGIPKEAVLEIVEVDDEVAFTVDLRGQGYIWPSQGYTPLDLAEWRFKIARPDLYPAIKETFNRPNISRVRVGKRKTYIVRFKWTPILTLRYQVEDRDYATPNLIAFEDLPIAFLRKIDTEYERLKKQGALDR